MKLPRVQIHYPFANNGHLLVVQFKPSANHANLHGVAGFDGIHWHWRRSMRYARGIVHFARNVNDDGRRNRASVRPNAGLCHCFCNAIYDGALFRAAQHALYVQIKPNVSGRKGADGMRTQNTRPRFNKSFGDAPAIHFVGHHLHQIVLHAAEVWYVRKWNAQFATKAGGMIQRMGGRGLIMRQSHEYFGCNYIEAAPIILIQFFELTLTLNIVRASFGFI